MIEPKFIRSILILIGTVLLVSLFFLPLNQPTPTNASLITPPPRDTPDSPPPPPPPPPPSHGFTDPKDKADDDRFAAIYGQVIDLSTGQPGQGIEVKINESIVRTDSQGRYSLTGLQPGAYTASLQLPGGATPAQDPLTVSLAEQETITLDLNYYSQNPPPPTSTPVPAAPPASASNQGAPGDEFVPPISGNFAGALPPANVIGPANLATTGNSGYALTSFTPSFGGNTVVWINPGRINNEMGVPGSIAVDVANVNDFGAFQATLKFNPQIIQIDNVTLGNFLDSTGRQTNPLVTQIDNTSGQISFVAFTSGDSAGPDGNGTLAVVNFTAKQRGVSNLELANVLLVDRLGTPLNAQVGNGQINVSHCFRDLNGDGIIDVRDVQAVAGRMNQVLGDFNYVPQYDLNNNGVIDRGDVTIITDHLYETCSGI